MAGSWGCILISDLDDTLVSSSGYHIADASLRRFNAAWAQVSGTKKLVYCTGRSLASFELLRSQTPSLQEPDVLICSVGTEIYRDPASAELDAEWEAALEKGWNREALLALASRIPGLQLQPASEQRPYKISFHVGGEKPDAVVEALRVAIGVDAARVIYSSSKDVDILPLRASKGAAAAFLLSQLASEAELPALTLRACALVAGDSGNDIELFALRTRGVVVGNARPELAAWADAHPSPDLLRARASAADGVVEALHHFRIIAASI